MTTVRSTLLLGLAALAGCGYDPGTKPEPTAVRGQVTFADGKPVRNVRLSFNPTSGDQMPGGVDLGADGTFRARLIPGKYIVTFESLTGKAAALKAIPAKYHTPDVAHTVEVATGREVQIQVAR
jgi:hypothetical protein